jgi:uroporphyrinogen III methyltransferase/synthase
MLIDRARRGLTVVRLKGGDPFIFGRGGEEIEALAEAGIPFEVVPGVTTPLGLAAYCGVPLTHRTHTSVVTFVTGHSVDAIDWDKVGGAETLVVFMGLTHLREIAQQIVARGRSPQTPALAVRWATRPDQQTVAGTLSDLADRTEAAGMKPPATIVIGEVAALRDKFNWFEKLPLFGQRIVVTRAHGQAEEFSAKLTALGADVVEFPTIAICPPQDVGPVERAIEQLDTYDWLLFTSVNGVSHFLQFLDRSPFDLRRLRARICAIGPATRRAVEELHLKVDVTPDEYVAESLLESFSNEDLAGKRVLLPRAAVARDLIPAEFTRRGAHIDVVEVYRTVVPKASELLAEEIFAPAHKPHWVTFTSSSTVKNFLVLAGREALEGVKIASIGPVTSETVRKHGLDVTVEAAPYTTDGLIAAMLRR